MSSITSAHSHSHSHSHPHSHSHNHASAAERNRAYFSSPDQIYLREKDFFDTFAANWTAEFLTHEAWLDLTFPQHSQSSDHDDTNTQTPPQKQGLRMLDYACGPGMASFAALKLTPSIVVAGKDGSDVKVKTRFDNIIGIDVAEGMVSLFNQRVQSSSGTNSDSAGEGKAKKQNNDEIPAGIHMQAYRGDLVSPATNPDDKTSAKTQQDTVSLAPEADLTDPQFSSFDLITCVAALHHFADPALAVAQLSKRLAPGGRLFVADMVPDSKTGAQTGAQTSAGAGTHGHTHSHAPGHGNHAPGHDHSNASGHAHEDTGLVHDGFSQAAVEGMFVRDGGLINVKSRVMDLAMGMPASFGGGERTVFWVIGEKPTTTTTEMV